MINRTKEALEHLSTFMNGNGSYYKAFTDSMVQYQEDLNAINNLVEKFEIGKKPIRRFRTSSIAETYVQEYCPLCETEIGRNFNFCPKCGGKIDWSK